MHNGIVFSDKFRERSQKEQLEYMEKLCASQNDALDRMQKERDALLKENTVLKQQAANADRAFQTQKEIVTNLVTKSNEDKEQYANRIRELENGHND